MCGIEYTVDLFSRIRFQRLILLRSHGWWDLNSLTYYKAVAVHKLIEFFDHISCSLNNWKCFLGFRSWKIRLLNLPCAVSSSKHYFCILFIILIDESRKRREPRFKFRRGSSQLRLKRYVAAYWESLARILFELVSNGSM